jgi:hypothetical protein
MKHILYYKTSFQNSKTYLIKLMGWGNYILRDLEKKIEKKSYINHF